MSSARSIRGWTRSRPRQTRASLPSQREHQNASNRSAYIGRTAETASAGRSAAGSKPAVSPLALDPGNIRMTSGGWILLVHLYTVEVADGPAGVVPHHVLGTEA